MASENEEQSDAGAGSNQDVSQSDEELDNAEPPWKLGFCKASLAKPEDFTKTEKAVRITVPHCSNYSNLYL